MKKVSYSACVHPSQRPNIADDQLLELFYGNRGMLSSKILLRRSSSSYSPLICFHARVVASHQRTTSLHETHLLKQDSE